MPIRVLIADDHALLREGLRKILEMEPDLTVVGEACDGLDAVAKVAQLAPEVVLMDINMPGGGGLEATRAVRERFPGVDVIALTIHDDDEYVVEMVNAGAKGYILKDVEPARVVEAIHRVHEGESFIPSNLMAKVFREFQRISMYGKKLQPVVESRFGSREIEGGEHEKLTAREMEILQQIVNGRTNKEIATALFISEKTVKNHVTNILKKLDLSDRTQAAVYALRYGLAQVD
jgi:DNA-binding NarL/FixJ family response regulator